MLNACDKCGAVPAEICDGLDNDCDGSTDEGVLNACDKCGAVPAETCDGLDNDCDGSTDEELNSPLSDYQDGVCVGALKVCNGEWVEPNYSDIPAYGLDDYFNPDYIDNDCNGVVDNPPPCVPNCPSNLDFMLIEGRSFMMGDQSSTPDINEIPIHNVIIHNFQIMRTEVTVAQYRTCVNADVCSMPRTGDHYNWSNDPNGKEDHPINGVSWHQMMKFAAWVGARLPTEAEWEYAARGGGQDIIYPWGDNSPSCLLANYSGCVGSTSLVCSTPNGNTSHGLCDMAGNVLEWVQDEWHDDYSGAPRDGSGWCSGICPVNTDDFNYNINDSTDRVLRGGGWSYEATILRNAYRIYDSPTYQLINSGGRLARTIP